MEIDKLIDKYFEGLTSFEEEKHLRLFFRGENVPDHLKDYIPLFAYLEQESKKVEQVNPVVPVIAPVKTKRYFFHSFRTIAAIVILLLGVAGLVRYLVPTAENYVIIDGKKYTDITLIHEQAQAAFQEVSFSEEDILATLFGD